MALGNVSKVEQNGLVNNLLQHCSDVLLCQNTRCLFSHHVKQWQLINLARSDAQGVNSRGKVHRVVTHDLDLGVCRIVKLSRDAIQRKRVALGIVLEVVEVKHLRHHLGADIGLELHGDPLENIGHDVRPLLEGISRFTVGF